MTIAFGLRPKKRRKQKSHKIRPGVNSPGSFLPGIEPEQLFVFDPPERPELPGPVRLHRVNLFKILVDTTLDACYIGVAKRRYAMKNITQHTGKIKLIERMPQSRNGNPRYLCAIMDSPNQDLGWTFRTQVDSSHGYEIPNYFDRDVDVIVTLGTHYGNTTLNSIRKA